METVSSLNANRHPNTGIVDQLKAWNQSWIGSSRNGDSDVTKSDLDLPVEKDDSQKESQDEQKETTELEKARLALSELVENIPSSDDGKSGKQHAALLRDSIVPAVFSVLYTANDDNTENGTAREASSSSSIQRKEGSQQNDQNPSTTASDCQLRQIEWHVVLVMELWASYGTPRRSKTKSKSLFLDTLVGAIQVYRDYQSSQRKDSIIITNKKKKKKKSKKREKDKAEKPKALSEKEKENLALDHMVRTLSRVPFLLPPDFRLSQFLFQQCWTSERKYWERLQSVVSHILEAFEIVNLFIIGDDNDDNDGENDRDSKDVANESSTTVLSADQKQTLQIDPNKAPGAAKNKRKPSRAQLQEISRNKKRQKLASLTLSKRKHRGSHFSSNISDISKLLDKKNTPSTANSKGSDAFAKLKKRKAAASAAIGKASAAIAKKNQRDLPLKKANSSIRKPSDALTENRKGNTNTSNEMNDRMLKSRIQDKKGTKRVGSMTKVSSEEKLQIQKAQKVNNPNQTSSIHRKTTSGLRTAQKENGSRDKTKIKNTINQQSSSNGVTTSYSKEETNETNFSRHHRGSRERSNTIDSLPMTPKKSRSSSDFVRETPIPSRRRESVVGETPIPSRRCESVVGETPISSRRRESVVGETPIHSRRRESVVGETPIHSRRRESVAGETPVPSRRRESVVGETPVPYRGTGVVGETPVPQRDAGVVGETPTSFDVTPMSFSSDHQEPFFSPPPLPSPSKLVDVKPTASTKQQAPARLFGTVRLLQRTSSINNLNGKRSGNGIGMKPGTGVKKSGAQGSDSSSIDKARAYLRRRSM